MGYFPAFGRRRRAVHPAWPTGTVDSRAGVGAGQTRLRTHSDGIDAIPGPGTPGSAVVVPDPYTGRAGEMDRVRDQIKAADWLIVPNWHDNNLIEWPEFAEVLAPFHKVEKLDLYTVYHRTPKGGG